MSESRLIQVAIVDYGLGNLFSVKHAFERVGLRAMITSRREDILSVPVVLLPGVGAFGDAMRTLGSLGLVEALHEVAASGKILLGICLGMQLLMKESHEFGRHEGLGLIEGDVLRLPSLDEPGERVKVPQVGWNRIHPFETNHGGTAWKATMLEGLSDGEYMYFVHSFYCRPADPCTTIATARYGRTNFCAALRRGNVFGCQFHPERSGLQGLRVYRNLAGMINQPIGEEQSVGQSGS